MKRKRVIRRSRELMEKWVAAEREKARKAKAEKDAYEAEFKALVLAEAASV